MNNKTLKLLGYYTVIFLAHFYIMVFSHRFSSLYALTVFVVIPALVFPLIRYGIKFWKSDTVTRNELAPILKSIPVFIVGYVLLYRAAMSLRNGDITEFFMMMLLTGLFVLIGVVVQFLRQRSTTGNLSQQKLIENQQRIIADLSELNNRVISIEKMLKEI